MMPQQEMHSENLNLFQRIRYSIFPGLKRPTKNRDDYRKFFNSLILHFRPRTVPQRTLRFTLTWGLGGMALVLTLLLFGTGILMKFIYQPFPERDYELALMDNEALIRRTAVYHIHVPDRDRLLKVISPLLYDPVKAVRIEAASKLAGEPSKHLDAKQKKVFESVLKEFVASMEYSGDFAFGRYNLGLLLQQLGRIEEAGAALNRALEIEPDSMDYLYAMADHYLRRGQMEKAGRIAEHMKEKYPNNPLGQQILKFIEKDEIRRRDQ